MHLTVKSKNLFGEDSHLNIHEPYLGIEFNVSDDAGGVIANDANVIIVNYGKFFSVLLGSFKLEIFSDKTIE